VSAATPAGALRPDAAALAAGVSLEAGRVHTVVLPELRLEVVGPAERTLWIRHPAQEDCAPRMPDADGFAARIVGAAPEAAAGATFAWTARLTYDTLQAEPRRSVVEFTATARGGTAPADLFRRAPGRILSGGSAAHPSETSAAGGRLSLAVTATLPDGRRAAGALPAGTYEVLARGNPTGAAVARALARAMPGAPDDAVWLAQILCVETGLRQISNVARAAASAYARRGHPVMNLLGDGGAGISQVTNPAPGPAELWDWRENVVAGIAIYRSKARLVRAFEVAVADALRGAPDASPHAELARLNPARRAQGLPPLDAVVAPPLTPEQVRDEMARGYNGFPRPRAPRHPRNRAQFGLAWHEFRLATAGSPPRLVTARERVEGGRRVADAVWERIPAAERPAYETTTATHRAGAPIGMADYVLRVREDRCGVRGPAGP
jgi:hypothetical protein